MEELFKVIDDPELMLLITEKEQLSKLEQSKDAGFVLETSWFDNNKR